jgi:hypothetical protein
MARKVLNRKELRAESEAAEKAEKKGEGKKKAAPDAAKKKPPAKRKSRAAAAEIRLKALWGVFNQSMKRVTVFEYDEKKKAEKKAAELSTSSKSPHFVQLVKEAITE